jgi:hypothetical protein
VAKENKMTHRPGMIILQSKLEEQLAKETVKEATPERTSF